VILELAGETVVRATAAIGYLHTGIEKNCEYCTSTQGVTSIDPVLGGVDRRCGD
jgi:NADH-quinone oxidoreductase subunit D